jgi:DNA-binding GntR family transcriptional regulator
MRRRDPCTPCRIRVLGAIPSLFNKILLTIYNPRRVIPAMQVRHDMRQMLEKRRQRSLTAEVRDALEGMILRGEIGRGERLNEHQLAEELGVSRGPVREAARALEREGLVTAVANQGVFVRDLTLEDALELYDLRAMIAGYLCAEAARSATKEAREALLCSVAEMEGAIAEGEEERYFALNLGFHDAVARASGARRAAALYTSLGKEVRLMRQRVLQGAASLRISNNEHLRIAQAILEGDVEGARASGAAHHANGKTRLLETMGETGDLQPTAQPHPGGGDGEGHFSNPGRNT